MRQFVAPLLAASLLGATSLAIASAERSAQVARGAHVFAETCAACHGEDGRAGAGYPSPIWGQGAKIDRFETAMGLFEYNQMLMPFDDPSRVSDEDKWAIVAFMLANHGVIEPSAEVEPDKAGSIPIR